MNANQVFRSTNASILAVAALVLGSPGAAAVVVLLAPTLPIDLSGPKVFALRSNFTAHALAFGDFEGQTDDTTVFPGVPGVAISHAGSVSAVQSTNPATSSFAEFQGRTQVGRLSAKTHAWVERGLGIGSAVMTMQFMDLLQVDASGVLNFNWNVSGTADQQIVQSGGDAGSSLTAQLFVWDYALRPSPGLPFAFANYAAATITGAGDHYVLPQTFHYFAGHRYWVLGQVFIESRATARDALRVLPPYRIETTADFSHTVELFITPDASTPEASFHSASGYDYRAAVIPEPSSWLLLLPGLLALRLRLRRG